MKRTANAHWKGTLMEGTGELSTPSTVLNNTQYSFKTRFADGIGTNPEELIGVALAGCYSMSLSAALAQAGFTAGDIFTAATVDLDIQALSILKYNLRVGTTKCILFSTQSFDKLFSNVCTISGHDRLLAEREKNATFKCLHFPLKFIRSDTYGLVQEE